MRTLLGVLVVAVCLAPVSAAVAVAPGATTQAATSATDSTGVDVTITVNVVDADGNSVDDANVTVTYNGTTQRSETFANGKAFFDVPDGADVSVDVSADDLALNRPKTLSNVDSGTTVNVTMYPAATAVLTVETPNEQPVEGARVRMRKDDDVLTSLSGRTAANGTFVAANVETGNYTVTVTASGYYSASSSFVVSNRAGKTMTVEPGTVTVNFRTIDGHFEGERPLNANVELYDGDEFVSNVSTGESGQRSVSLDVNTNYRVVVTKSGYQRTSQVLPVGESDSSMTYAINRTPSLSIEAANTQVVTGQTVRVSVTDEYDEPVVDASVRVGGETVAATDENGEAVVTIESAGSADVVATKGDLDAMATVQGVAPSTESTTTVTTTEAPTTTEVVTTTTEVVTTTEAVTSTTESGSGGLPTPGFGGVAALVAVAVSLLVLGRRLE
jgi:hypothetical protein